MNGASIEKNLNLLVDSLNTALAKHPAIQRAMQRTSGFSTEAAILASFVSSTGCQLTPLTADSFLQAVHSLFMSTLGIPSPGKERVQTLFRIVALNGMGTVTLEEFRSAAPRIVALGAFWVAAGKRYSKELDAVDMQLALRLLGLDVDLHQLRAMYSSKNDYGRRFDWQQFWELFPLVRSLDVSFVQGLGSRIELFGANRAEQPTVRPQVTHKCSLPSLAH